MSQVKSASSALPIAIDGVTKTYGKVFALNKVRLEIRSGEFMTLLGPSGSGKTTLLMVLAGFTRPDYGSVRFGDEEIVRSPPHKRNVGMVFQNYALFPHMNVAANVGFPLRLRKVAKAEITERVENALDTVQLGGFGGRSIDQLSGGQRQRVALARAIVFEPRILLMDEPLSALDKKLREHMQIELRQLHDKLGMTTVYVTHDQREALTMSDRIAVINHGRLMQLDEPKAIYDRPASRFIADFIGESSFLPVEVKAGKAMFEGREIMTQTAPDGDGSRLLLLRPERVQVLAAETGAGHNIIDATVRDVVYQGDSFLMVARTASGHEVAVRGLTRSASLSRVPPPGAPVRLSLDPAETTLIAEDDA